jgi:hypothetical protein
MTRKLFCGMTFSLKNPRKKADNKDEDFLLSSYTGKDSAEVLRFVRGPSLGEYFSPRVGRWPP